MKALGSVCDGALGGMGTDRKSLAQKLVRFPYLSDRAPSYSQRTPRLTVNLLVSFQSSCTKVLMLCRWKLWMIPCTGLRTQNRQLEKLLLIPPVVLPGFATLQVPAWNAAGWQPARPISRSANEGTMREPTPRPPYTSG